MTLSLLAIRLVMGVSGATLVGASVSAAVRSFVLPRPEPVALNAGVLMAVRYLFQSYSGFKKTYRQRDRVLAHYAPFGLLALPLAWLLLIDIGSAAVFWSFGEGGVGKCLRQSFAASLAVGPHDQITTGASAFAFVETALSVLLATLLLSYLPTIYQTFARREVPVVQLELRSGRPLSPTALLVWLNRHDSLAAEEQQWGEWERWFVEIEESHTSLPTLVFFRSPVAGRSWVRSAILCLDAASLLLSACDVPKHREAELTFRAGCSALRSIQTYFTGRLLSGEAEAQARLPDAFDRSAFDAILDELRAKGLPVQRDREEAWTAYRRHRGEWVPAAAFLVELTMAPPTHGELD